MSTEGKAEKKEEDVPFDWKEYLARTKAEKAPRQAFFQPHKMPSNPFKVGQLILAKDKHAHLMVLSKIRHVHKCWLYIHIEGLDETHCRWVICDDRDLAPVGPINEKLKVDNRDAYPPTGLKSNFKKWIVQQFKDQDDNIADISLFEPVALKYQPKGNQFEVGMKLAAYDEKSFDGKLSPATIVDVNKGNLKLNFDGWPSSYDITVPFYSRCIFPIDFVIGAGLAVNVPRIMPAPEAAKTPKDGRRRRSSQSDDAANSPASDNDEDNPDGPLSKRRRMGFFDANNKPMRPGQRAAAMKEQVTGVKAKVIDILREASEAQEREESREPARNMPPKLVPMVPKVVRIEGGQVTTVHPVGDGNLRSLAPKPSIVYSNSNSGTIYVPKQSQSYAQSSVRSAAVQPVHPNESRLVTLNRPKTIVPTSGYRIPGHATTVTTAAGDFILADPNIKSALRQTLEDSNGVSFNAPLAGVKDEKVDPDAPSRRPMPSVVARMQRNVMGNESSLLSSESDRPKLSAEERVKLGWSSLGKPSSSDMNASSSQIKASPLMHNPRASLEMRKRAISVRPLSHTPTSDPQGVRRMDHMGQASSSSAGRPVTVVSAVRPLTSQGALIHMKKPLMARPRVSMPGVMASGSRDGQPHMRPLNSTPNTPHILANARNRPINPPISQMPSLAQQAPVVPDLPPPDIKVKIDEYKRETRTVQKNLDDAIVKMYVNKGCQAGPMLDSKKIKELHDYHPLPYHAQITRVVQDLIYCAWVPKEAFDMVKNIGPDAPGMKITILHGKELLTKTIPIHLSAISALMWLRDFLTTLNCCPHLISPSEFSCESCDSAEKHARHPGNPTAVERVPKYKREFDVLKKLGAHLGGVEDVAREYRKRLGDEVAQLIIDNQIDSSVLPFCQEDLLREQMKLPYNTALKMAAVACELRAAAFESVPGIDQMDLDLK